MYEEEYPRGAGTPVDELEERPQTDIKKVLLVAIALISLAVIAWELYPALLDNEDDNVQIVPVVNDTPAPEVTRVIEFPPTGKEYSIKVNSRRGFIPHNMLQEWGNVIEITAGDNVYWSNDEVEPVTIVSEIPDFGTTGSQVLDQNKRVNYTFTRPGTYNFYLEGNKALNNTILVRSP